MFSATTSNQICCSTKGFCCSIKFFNEIKIGFFAQKKPGTRPGLKSERAGN